MKKYVYLIFLILIFSNTFSIEKTVDIKNNDKTMNEIIDDARKNIDIFISKLKNHDENEWAFQVKYPFQIKDNTSYNVEHIWLSDIFVKEDQYYGIVSNDPYYIKNIKYGDIVQFDINKITDWMYYKEDKIIGGKSIKYLLEKIPENQRTQEEKSYYEMFQ